MGSMIIKEKKTGLRLLVDFNIKIFADQKIIFKYKKFNFANFALYSFLISWQNESKHNFFFNNMAMEHFEFEMPNSY
ncbi:hypothetical protein BpHYR1_020279 [Brachionus plicatilis]|uniref:Uncharacterized protein n=1 Tax=Brachionus plicatilis TaxID=10195 RepID=A0A3M7QJ29_BRAPC|nr:hypothetical protein BpHYR1_020279 [Brachionus plicatilis]